MAYKILENCLRTEKWIERQTVPEKAGEGIIALFRRDLEGVICKNLGTDRVFQLIDNGDGDGARDELQFYTTREPTALVDAGPQAGTADDPSRRTITPVTYFLKENNLGLFTLFRREVTNYESDPFTGGSGINFEIYDKVRSLNIYAFDDSQDDQGVQAGYSPWVPAWDSQQRYAEADDLAANGTTASTGAATSSSSSTGIPRVTDSSKASAGQTTDDDTVLPPSPIPSAVRVEISILAGDERGLFKEADGTPMAPLVFSTVIPILASQRFPLTPPEDTSTQTTGADSGSAAADGTGSTSTGSGTTGSKTPKVTAGSKSGR